MTSGRARTDEYVHRVNQAMKLLTEERLPSADVARQLALEHSVSVRQAWRYVRDAAEQSQPLEVPEQKVVFTVKVPESLVARVRAVAKSRGQTLSAFVTVALEEHLRCLRAGGRDGGKEN